MSYLFILFGVLFFLLSFVAGMASSAAGGMFESSQTEKDRMNSSIKIFFFCLCSATFGLMSGLFFFGMK